jgi:cytochrome b
MAKILIWDLPVRLFHWLLLLLVTVSVTTGLVGGYMDYHMMSGFGILALLLFRIGWGFIGSYHARFRNFMKGPATTLGYVGEAFRFKRGGQNPVHYPGHNPLGALSVIAMLAALMFQAVTGLFANDDFFTEGPLAYLVSYDTSRELTGLHKRAKWVLGGLIALHLIAIAWYQFARSTNLVGPMITGRKEITDVAASADDQHDPHRYPFRAVVLAVLCGALVYWVTALG